MRVPVELPSILCVPLILLTDNAVESQVIGACAVVGVASSGKVWRFFVFFTSLIGAGQLFCLPRFPHPFPR